MKLSNLFLFTGVAITSYLLVKNRESITDEISDTGQLLHKAQDSLSEIQANLSYLREQKSTLEDISKDLQYKINVFNQEAQARFAEIQDIWESSPIKQKNNENQKESSFHTESLTLCSDCASVPVVVDCSWPVGVAVAV